MSRDMSANFSKSICEFNVMRVCAKACTVFIGQSVHYTEDVITLLRTHEILQRTLFSPMQLATQATVDVCF